MGIPFLYFTLPFVIFMQPLMILALGVTLVLTGLACAYVAMSMVKKNSEMAVTLVTAVLLHLVEVYVAWNINRFIFKHIIS